MRCEGVCDRTGSGHRGEKKRERERECVTGTPTPTPCRKKKKESVTLRSELHELLYRRGAITNMYRSMCPGVARALYGVL